MLRNILIGMDLSGDGDPVLGLGVRWARRYGAKLTGIAIIDDPGLQAPAGALVAEVHHGPGPGAEVLLGARREAHQSMQRFAGRCAEAGVALRTVEDVGSPHARIIAEAQRHDLILLATESRFDFGWQGTPGDTLAKILRDCPRPVVAVPEAPVEGTSVVVAYDGSLPAARALHAFEASGLGLDRKVYVVGVAADRAEAARHCEPAVEFLAAHEIRAEAHPVQSRLAPAEAILGKVESLDADLLVMGAYGRPTIMEFFLGSVTRRMLKSSTVPVFLFH